MLRRIKNGEADGIVAWHPDRLARNSIDGGQIIYFLDTKSLKDLRFATFTFENNSQGKFMLSIIFGYSKYYVDSLSENVRRGNRTKMEQGWLPHIAPVGYLNDKDSRTIISDPDRFALIQKMWHLVLTGAYSPKEIWQMSIHVWGLRTAKRKRIGGKPLSLSTIYKMFTNRFYAGVIEYEGKTFPGKHEAMITLDEFDRMQELLGRPGRPRPKKKSFAFTGMIRCGECGLFVTAEEKLNRHGSRYVYYHCGRKRRDFRCRQPYISLALLEEQIESFLEGLMIPDGFHEWALGKLKKTDNEIKELKERQRASLESATRSLGKELENLTTLRIRDLLTDDEYITQRRKLEREQIGARQSLEALSADATVEPEQLFISFSNRALNWFTHGDQRAKRLIVEIVGSNLSLKDKKLSIDARKPFQPWPKDASIPTMWGIVEDVRTLLHDPTHADTVHKLQHVVTMCAHENQDRGVIEESKEWKLAA